ncbi:UNVERIFIED_ORG: hypothetical protein J2W85_002417 [Ensifer adhaerens]|nr:hypothetical protein [Ensifer adhaerens]
MSSTADTVFLAVDKSAVAPRSCVRTLRACLLGADLELLDAVVGDPDDLPLGFMGMKNPAG